MRKRSNMRLANGIVAALIVCFFMAHGLLGSFAPVFSFTSSFLWVVWVGVALVAVHVVLSIATSYEQMTDADFPPSSRKKRHLALKWVTGALLAAAISVHIAYMRIPGIFDSLPAAPAVATIVLAVLLAWHICVGAKSMLKDIGLGKGLMTPVRIIVCALAAVFSVVAIVLLVR